MIKIIDAIKLDEYKRDDDSVYCLSIKIMLSNGESNTIDFFGEVIEDAKEYLCNIEWKNEILKELERTIEGSEEDNEEYWINLMDKVVNNKVLNYEESNSINFVMTTGTVFKEFDYKTWAL